VQDAHIVEAFRKNWPRTLKAHLCDLLPRTKMELWFQDEGKRQADAVQVE